MLNKTMYAALLLLTPALSCFAQGSKPSEPQLDALMAFEREIESVPREEMSPF